MSRVITSELPVEAAPHRILSKAQVAELIGQHPAQVNRLVKAGRLPRPFRIGERKLGWRLSAILDHLAKAERERSGGASRPRVGTAAAAA
jgi:predicted DNA-binding transcriptional regulator AlpA